MDPDHVNLTPQGSHTNKAYSQRLKQLEDDNQALRKELHAVSRWKRRMEVWMYEQFDVRFEADSSPESDSPVKAERGSGSDASPIPKRSALNLASPVDNKNSSGASSSSGSSSLSSVSSAASTPPIPPKKRKTDTEYRFEKPEIPLPSGNVDFTEILSPPIPLVNNQTAKKSTKSYNGGDELKPGPKSKKHNGNVNNGNIDEEARCSVCDDKYAEDDNEMLFCDKCNICVHQACYGVNEIPETEWFCKPCTKGLAELPKCMFCPNTGGAMVPVRSPSMSKWAHVFCAMWLPEVTFQDPAIIDFVINVDKINKSRWSMKCCLCKMGKGHGACIQCQWKKCTTAFHVTCASKHKLKMEGVLDDALPGGVVLMAYCQRHRNMEG